MRPANYLPDVQTKRRWHESEQRGGISHVPSEGKWCFAAVRVYAMLASTIEQFKEDSPNAYHAAVENDWLGRICTHMPEPLQPILADELEQVGFGRSE